jgi:hypothetical protein
MRTTKGRAVWLVLIEQVGGNDFEIYSTQKKAERRVRAIEAEAKRNDDWDTMVGIHWMVVE